MRGFLHDREDAVSVAARLSADGFTAEVDRDRFAGEDDDEDHRWTVLSDAPQRVFEVLMKEYDGWADSASEAEPTAVLPAPPELPVEPRRIKNHFPRD